LNFKKAIAKTRYDIESLKQRLKLIGFRMGILQTNSFLIERKILTREERDWLLMKYRDDVVAIKIILNQCRDKLEFNVLTYELFRRRYV